MASGNRRRDPGKERFWRGVMRRQRRGGLSVREFCEREGLKEWSFHWWRRELDKRDREQPASSRDRLSFVSASSFVSGGRRVCSGAAFAGTSRGRNRH